MTHSEFCVIMVIVNMVAGLGRELNFQRPTGSNPVVITMRLIAWRELPIFAPAEFAIIRQPFGVVAPL